MARWNRLSTVEAIQLLQAQGNRKTGPHRMTGLLMKHWPFCVQCGLVALKNDPTRRALRTVCSWEED